VERKEKERKRKKKGKPEKCIFRIEDFISARLPDSPPLPPFFRNRRNTRSIAIPRDKSQPVPAYPSAPVTPALYPFLSFYEFNDTVLATRRRARRRTEKRFLRVSKDRTYITGRISIR
jgi:hypothetical protein